MNNVYNDDTMCIGRPSSVVAYISWNVDFLWCSGPRDIKHVSIGMSCR